MIYLSVAVGQQRTVGADVFPFFPNGAIRCPVETNRVFGILEDFSVRLYFIGYIGINKYIAVEKTFQPSLLALFKQFEQFQQINNLMIAPVSDV